MGSKDLVRIFVIFSRHFQYIIRNVVVSEQLWLAQISLKDTNVGRGKFFHFNRPLVFILVFTSSNPVPYGP